MSYEEMLKRDALRIFQSGSESEFESKAESENLRANLRTKRFAVSK